MRHSGSVGAGRWVQITAPPLCLHLSRAHSLARMGPFICEGVGGLVGGLVNMTPGKD